MIRTSLRIVTVATLVGTSWMAVKAQTSEPHSPTRFVAGDDLFGNLGVHDDRTGSLQGFAADGESVEQERRPRRPAFRWGSSLLSR